MRGGRIRKQPIAVQHVGQHIHALRVRKEPEHELSVLTGGDGREPEVLTFDDLLAEQLVPQRIQQILTEQMIEIPSHLTGRIVTFRLAVDDGLRGLAPELVKAEQVTVSRAFPDGLQQNGDGVRRDSVIRVNEPDVFRVAFLYAEVTRRTHSAVLLMKNPDCFGFELFRDLQRVVGGTVVHYHDGNVIRELFFDLLEQPLQRERHVVCGNHYAKSPHDAFPSVLSKNIFLTSRSPNEPSGYEAGFFQDNLKTSVLSVSSDHFFSSNGSLTIGARSKSSGLS